VEPDEGPAIVFPFHLKHYANVAPYDYECNGCGATRCKLWRLHNKPDIPSLACVDCAAQYQDMELVDLDDAGTHVRAYGDRTNQIGWFVPAVPATDNAGEYWEYDQIPEERYEWWEGLPNRPLEFTGLFEETELVLVEANEILLEP